MFLFLWNHSYKILWLNGHPGYNYGSSGLFKSLQDLLRYKTFIIALSPRILKYLVSKLDLLMEQFVCLPVILLTILGAVENLLATSTTPQRILGDNFTGLTGIHLHPSLLPLESSLKTQTVHNINSFEEQDQNTKIIWFSLKNIPPSFNI